MRCDDDCEHMMICQVRRSVDNAETNEGFGRIVGFLGQYGEIRDTILTVLAENCQYFTKKEKPDKS